MKQEKAERIFLTSITVLMLTLLVLCGVVVAQIDEEFPGHSVSGQG